MVTGPTPEATHWWKLAAAAVGEGVAIGVKPLCTMRRVDEPSVDGDGWVYPVGGMPWSTVDETMALWRNPGALVRSGGAVWQTTDLPVADFMPEGVRPDGTSMKVFFTGSGTPLLVAPSSVAAPGAGAATTGLATATPPEEAAGWKSSSESGAGRLGGMPPATPGKRRGWSGRRDGAPRQEPPRLREGGGSGECAADPTKSRA
mmetsp:Transcript_4775/g.10634  ORF Transcript_4775/g.10634 Transcript_4775/m.10634 type:complete len:203 (-) Transcript_4775:4-612(-)